MKRWYRVYRESYCEVHAQNEEDAKHEARKLPKECWKNDVWTPCGLSHDPSVKYPPLTVRRARSEDNLDSVD